VKVRDKHASATARARAAVPLSARAVLTVDLSALRANWARLNEASGRAECAGVIKADAYGLGLGPIAQALINEGCKTFFVATVDEGRAAREVHPGATVYVLDGLLPGAEPHYAGFDLRPVLSSLSEVRDWAPTAARGAASSPPPSTSIPASTGWACRSTSSTSWSPSRDRCSTSTSRW
jgi:alanine racemase